MNQPLKILMQVLVKPFYRENAGFFVLLFIIMFCIIGKVDGAGVFEYHYSLITGMLTNYYFLMAVFFTWFLYTRKFTAFVSAVIHHPKYTFLSVFNSLEKAKQLRLFAFIEALLLLPVLVYAVLVISIGYHEHYYTTALLVMAYLPVLCVAPAAWHVYQLNSLHKHKVHSWARFNVWPSSSFYPFILLRFVSIRQRLTWAGIKAFTCCLLYLIARNNTANDYDTSFPFLFFNFGILANGILVYRIREFEETWLTLYRGAPVSLFRRFSSYVLVYGLLLMPEFITAFLLTPVHLHAGDALRFSLCGYSLLMLMNSLTFYKYKGVKEFLKMLLLVFCVQYLFLMTAGLTFLYLLFFAVAATIFLKRYYHFEANVRD